MNATGQLLPQRSTQKIHFDNTDMDFYLSRFMGYTTYGGAEHGECLHVASQIEDGDPHSWVEAWRKMAQHVEAQAMTALETGHLVSAREAYLRAFTYYRASLTFIRPADPSFLDAWEDMRSCFRMASALSQPPITHIEIPFGDKTLSGYFMHVNTEPGPHPTIIAIGDGETFAEELYFWAAAPAALRGYDTIFVEIPGQGSTPMRGLCQRPDAEVPISAIADYALTLLDVDPDRLYIYGVGGGSYMAARAVAYDKRIKACVLNAPVTNLYTLMTSELPSVVLRTPDFLNDSLLRTMTRQSPVTEVLLERLCWQFGERTISEVLEAARLFNLDQLIDKIDCPTFCLVSEGEPTEQSRQAREFYSALDAPRQLRIFTCDEGAEAPCQANNLSAQHFAIFDWLDDL